MENLFFLFSVDTLAMKEKTNRRRGKLRGALERSVSVGRGFKRRRRGKEKNKNKRNLGPAVSVIYIFL